MSLHNLAWIESSLPTYGMTRPDPSLSALDFVQPGLSLPPRTLAQLGLAMPAYGLCRPGLSTLVPDLAHVGSSLALRALSRPGSALLTYGFLVLLKFLFFLHFRVVGFCL